MNREQDRSGPVVDREIKERFHVRVQQERAEAGLPPVISDPAVLRQVAEVLRRAEERRPRQEGPPAAGGGGSNASGGDPRGTDDGPPTQA